MISSPQSIGPKLPRGLGSMRRGSPTQNSWAYDQIIDGIRQDRIKGLWVIATNTAHSWFQHDLREILGKLDFLVVQDMYHTTEMVQLADLVLPAAAWGEKEGTFINSERRIGLMKKVARAPGQALADFSIFKLVAEYWGCGELFARWTDPEATFQILKEISRGQPCDISGIVDYRQIDEWGGIQWPFTNSEFGVRNAESNSEDAPHSTFRTPHSEFVERRLFADGRFFHADGKARFLFAEPAAMPEPPCGEYPLILLTGRGTASQWHTQSRTEKSAVLRRLYPSKLYVEMHPVDAHRLGIVALDRVTVASRRGELTATALITPTIQPGQVFLPMHYAETNRLTLWHIDPYSRQPSYKDCAVRVAGGRMHDEFFQPRAETVSARICSGNGGGARCAECRRLPRHWQLPDPPVRSILRNNRLPPRNRFTATPKIDFWNRARNSHRKSKPSATRTRLKCGMRCVPARTPAAFRRGRTSFSTSFTACSMWRRRSKFVHVSPAIAGGNRERPPVAGNC